MSRHTGTANKPKGKSAPGARTTGRARPRAGGGDGAFGPAEKLLLGMAPPDSVDTIAEVSGGARAVGRIAARVAMVQDFLARNPDVRSELAAEAAETWKRVRGKHAAFTAAIAERRAQLLSRAQLASFNDGAPAAAANARKEVARYLAELEGISGG